MADAEVTNVAGLKAAHDQSAAGDTITLRAGTYYMRRGEPGAYWYLTHSGNNGSPVTYQAATGENVYLDFSDVIAGASWDQDGDVYSADVSGLSVGDSSDMGAFAGGWMCSHATALSQLTSPAAELYSGDSLTFDLTFYDSTAKRLYFRSNDVSAVAPGDLRIVSTYSKLYLDASYITLSGLRFRYGDLMIHCSSVSAKAGIKVQDCDIRHCRSGILSSSPFVGTEVENCYIDQCGYPMHFTTAWTRNNAGHGIYTYGPSAHIHNNVICRAIGAGIHAWPDVSGGMFERNVLLNISNQAALYQGTGGVFKDNIAVGFRPRWRGEEIAAYSTGNPVVGIIPFYTNSGMVIEHNYMENVYGCGIFWSPASTSALRLTNNILRGITEAACLVDANVPTDGYTKFGNVLSPITNPPSGEHTLSTVAGREALLDAVTDYENPVPRIRQLARDYVAPWQPWPLPQSKRRIVALMMEF